MKELFSILKRFWFKIILMFTFTYVQVMATLAIPDYMRTIVNEGIMKGDQTIILWNGGYMIIASIIAAIFTIAVVYLASQVGAAFSKELRSKVFEKIESYSLQEFNHFSTASLITRTTNDIEQIQRVIIMIFRMMLAAPLTAFVAIIKARDAAPDLTWILEAGVGLLLIIVVIIFVTALPKFSILQKLVDKINLVTRENLSGLRVVRAFNAQKYEEKKFAKVSKDLMSTNIFVNRLMAILQPSMMMIFNVIAVVIIWVSAELLGDVLNEFALGDMFAFTEYATQIIRSFLMMIIVIVLTPRASISVKRIIEILRTNSSVEDPETEEFTIKNMNGVVEFRNVTFSYPRSEEPVLTDISFKAEPGKVTAIVGGTGSGKSTLVNLIPRFFDTTSGEVLVNGVDVKATNQSTLRSHIGYIPQKGLLFSGTVSENISFGNPDAVQELVTESADIAQASEFILQMSDGYETHIAQGGKNVSGGQKQRLAIARALLIEPNIYIFDDSFSALDFKTDLALRKALKPKTKNATVFIVAQRVGTILDADQILVLEKGKLVGVGTHSELMSSCTVYKEIAESQLSKEEL